jgi:hypothetical protein
MDAFVPEFGDSGDDCYISLSLIIRPFAVRGALSLEEAVDLVPEEAEKVAHMYGLSVEVGWIAP